MPAPRVISCVVLLMALVLCAGIALFVVGVTAKKKGLWITGVVLGGLAMLVIGALVVLVVWFVSHMPL